MGIYVNPVNGQPKEDWLRDNGRPLANGEPIWPPPAGHLPVCLLYNPTFTAALVIDSEHELRRSHSPRDMRRREWFVVPIDRLIEHSDLGIQRPDMAAGDAP